MRIKNDLARLPESVLAVFIHVILSEVKRAKDLALLGYTIVNILIDESIKNDSERLSGKTDNFFLG